MKVMSENSDAELVEMVRERGETSAYGELIQRYQGHAYGLAYSIVGDWAEAQDMAQEAFIRAYVNLHTLAKPAKFPAWLRRIVFSTCMDWVRKSHPELYQSLGRPDGIDDLDAIPDSGATSPFEHTLGNEMSKVVLAAIDDLPQKYRIPLTMFHLDGLSYKKVADFLEIPIGTVQSLISRARKRLKPALESYAREVFPMVKEVLDEHKLADEFAQSTMKKIEGMEDVFWGGESNQQNSVMGALTAAMRVMGEEVDYEYLMGIGGAAFRLQFAWSPAAPHAQVGRNCTNPAMEALGYPLTWINTKDMRSNETIPEGVAQAREAIVSSINGGRPVLLSSEECGLITGYTGNGKGFLVRPYSAEFAAQKVGYSPMKEWPWQVGIIGPKGHAPTRKLSIIKSLEAAIEMANTEYYGDYASGYNAYGIWMAQLRDDEEMTRKINDDWWGTALGSGFTYGCLSTARLAGAKYLRQVNQEFSGDMRVHLAKAAEHYQQVYDVLETKRPDVPLPWFLLPWDLKKPENWTREMRHGQADVLSQIMAIEKQGLAELGLALKAAE